MEYILVSLVLKVDDIVNYPVEFLNSLNPLGFQPHLLILNIGTSIFYTYST